MQKIGIYMHNGLFNLLLFSITYFRNVLYNRQLDLMYSISLTNVIPIHLLQIYFEQMYLLHSSEELFYIKSLYFEDHILI